MERNGFTLIELLVVIVILGIITTISLANFRNSQVKARDAQRKSDLSQIAKALEAYVNDHGVYPPAESGKIDACDCNSEGVCHTCDWDQEEELDLRELNDEHGTIYMIKVPGDPTGNPHYCYETNDAYTWYKLFAQLENSRDPEAGGPYSCAGYDDYNFAVTSTNTRP